MTIKLFDFKDNLTKQGRVGRLHFWVLNLRILMVQLALLGAIVLPVSVVSENVASVLENIVAVLILPLTIMAYIRRLHDFNFNGWWLLVAVVISVVLSVLSATAVSAGWAIYALFAFVLGFLFTLSYVKGNKTENKFGDDTLNPAPEFSKPAKYLGIIYGILPIIVLIGTAVFLVFNLSNIASNMPIEDMRDKISTEELQQMFEDQMPEIQEQIRQQKMQEMQMTPADGTPAPAEDGFYKQN